MDKLNKRLEDIESKAQADLDKARREIALLRELPEELQGARAVHFFRDEPWICYRAETLDKAAELGRRFPMPATLESIESGGIVYIGPPALASRRYENGKSRWVLDQAVELAQHGSKGFFSAQLGFHVAQPSGSAHTFYRIKIDIDKFPWNLRARVACSYNRYGDPVNPTFHDATELSVRADATQKYSGGSHDAFDKRWYFSGADCWDRIAELDHLDDDKVSEG